MYLIDTTVWLECLLDQTRSEEVGHFLQALPSERRFITDFAFHSIGVVMSRLDRKEATLDLRPGAFIDGAVVLIHLEAEDTRRLVNVRDQFNLDFDDAYQYTAAEKNDLTIVSFDTDFDRTDCGKKTPQEVLEVSGRGSS